MIEDLRARVAGAFRDFARVGLRSVWPPSRSEYFVVAAEATSDPNRLLKNMLGSRADDRSPTFSELTAQQLSPLWPIDPTTQQFLGGFVRAVRPKRVFETGVADGASSRIILDGLEQNGDGRLWSVDVLPQAGALARESPAVHRWEFTVLPARGRADAFRRAIRAPGPLDVFLHDSDHSYPWQSFEYREAWAVLAPGGWLLSDDIDASYAFLDLTRRHALRPWVLAGPRKLFGVVRKPG